MFCFTAHPSPMNLPITWCHTCSTVCTLNAFIACFVGVSVCVLKDDDDSEVKLPTEGEAEADKGERNQCLSNVIL